MAKTPEGGSFLVAALLLLVLGFAGSWIIEYVKPDARPWALVPWFAGAAAVIIVVGLTLIVIKGRRS